MLDGFKYGFYPANATANKCDIATIKVSLGPSGKDMRYHSEICYSKLSQTIFAKGLTMG